MLDETVKEGAKWAYEGAVEVLNGLWKPFGDRAFGLINLLGSTVIPIRGKTTMEQEEDLFNALYDIHGEKTGFLMDHPAISPFPDGLGLFVVYTNAEAERNAIAKAADLGVGIDPQKPDQWEPLGLRADPTPYEIPGVNTHKYRLTTSRKTSRMGAMNNMFDSLFGGLHYGTGGEVENPELMTAFKQQNAGKIPTVHSAESPFPEANYYNPQFQNGGGLGMAHPVGEGWADYAGRMDVGKRLLYILGEQETDSPSSGESYDLNTENLALWLAAKDKGEDAESHNRPMGKYQIKPSTWQGLLANSHMGIGGNPSVDVTNPHDQDRLAQWEISRLLDKHQGDIGRVAAEWYTGYGTANRNWSAGTDTEKNDPHPTMMEYARDVVRAYHYYSRTGSFQSPETLLETHNTLVPYDSEGQPILWQDDPNRHSTPGTHRGGGYE